MSEHQMVTRSKNNPPHQPDEMNDVSDSESDIDSNGNIKDLIDYECDKTFDKKQ